MCYNVLLIKKSILFFRKLQIIQDANDHPHRLIKSNFQHAMVHHHFLAVVEDFASLLRHGLRMCVDYMENRKKRGLLMKESLSSHHHVYSQKGQC